MGKCFKCSCFMPFKLADWQCQFLDLFAPHGLGTAKDGICHNLAAIAFSDRSEPVKGTQLLEEVLQKGYQPSGRALGRDILLDWEVYGRECEQSFGGVVDFLDKLGVVFLGRMFFVGWVWCLLWFDGFLGSLKIDGEFMTFHECILCHSTVQKCRSAPIYPTNFLNNKVFPVLSVFKWCVLTCILSLPMLSIVFPGFIPRFLPIFSSQTFHRCWRLLQLHPRGLTHQPRWRHHRSAEKDALRGRRWKLSSFAVRTEALESQLEFLGFFCTVYFCWACFLNPKRSRGTRMSQHEPTGHSRVASHPPWGSRPSDRVHQRCWETSGWDEGRRPEMKLSSLSGDDVLICSHVALADGVMWHLCGWWPKDTKRCFWLSLCQWSGFKKCRRPTLMWAMNSTAAWSRNEVAVWDGAYCSHCVCRFRFSSRPLFSTDSCCFFTLRRLGYCPSTNQPLSRHIL